MTGYTPPHDEPLRKESYSNDISEKLKDEAKNNDISGKLEYNKKTNLPKKTIYCRAKNFLKICMYTAAAIAIYSIYYCNHDKNETESYRLK